MAPDGRAFTRFDAVKDNVLNQTHSPCVDSRDDIYVVEIAEDSPAIQRFARI